VDCGVKKKKGGEEEDHLVDPKKGGGYLLRINLNPPADESLGRRETTLTK